MSDKLTKEKRSWNMSRIKSRGTKPEIRVRSLLHRMGFRFRVNKKDLPGHPDLVLPRYKTVIFVHGCFWHRHKKCKYSYIPKTNIEFWQNKFSSNILNDKKQTKTLKNMGWKVFVIWECQLAEEKRLMERIKKNLGE